MKRLITMEEAAKLVAGSEERKSEIIEQMNASISDQAKKGLRWDHLPSNLSELEKEWLSGELAINGFTVKNNHPAITW